MAEASFSKAEVLQLATLLKKRVNHGGFVGKFVQIFRAAISHQI